jgi:hypothetical protein
MKGLIRQIAVFASVVIMIVGLSIVSTGNPDFEGAGPDGTTSTTYDMYPTAVSPAPWTFTIWGPIFLGTLALGVYQALPKNRKDARLDALGLPLISAFLLNGLTGFVPIGISVLVIVALLAALAWTFTVMIQFEPGDRQFNFFVRAPILIFFSWINVATIVNISQWLVSLGWGGFGVPAAGWAALLILIAAGIGAGMVKRYQNLALYAIVLVWAFIGIVAVKPSSLPVLAASVAGALLLAWAWFSSARSRGASQSVRSSAKLH